MGTGLYFLWALPASLRFPEDFKGRVVLPGHVHVPRCSSRVSYATVLSLHCMCLAAVSEGRVLQ